MVNMKNEPAMPIVSNGNVLSAGLTKREMMAMHMMAARVSIPGAPDDEFDAKRAVAATDALLAELDRTSK